MPPVRLRPQPFLVEKHSRPGSKDFRAFYFREVSMEAMEKVSKCIFIADGEAAGQEVFHFHLHVYPRFQGDGFGFKYDKAKHFITPARSELDEIAWEIRSKLIIEDGCDKGRNL
jgi:hypothetical protein